MKKLALLIALFLCNYAFSQEVVTLLVSGEGNTKQEAIDGALRSAIEQTFGAFVSANTTIINDRLVKDEIATVSSGNIQKYEEINYFTKENKSYITLQATVSIKKLVAYAKAHGSSCELNGAAFSAEIRRIRFNQKNTKIAFENLTTQLEAIIPSMFNARVDVHMKTDGEVICDFIIEPDKIALNEYFKIIYDYLMNLQIPNSEVEHLKSIGEEAYKITIHKFDPNTNRFHRHAYTQEIFLYAPLYIDEAKMFLKNTYYYLVEDNLNNKFYLETNTNLRQTAYSKHCSNTYKPLPLPLPITEKFFIKGVFNKKYYHYNNRDSTYLLEPRLYYIHWFEQPTCCRDNAHKYEDLSTLMNCCNFKIQLTKRYNINDIEKLTNISIRRASSWDEVKEFYSDYHNPHTYNQAENDYESFYRNFINLRDNYKAQPLPFDVDKVFNKEK